MSNQHSNLGKLWQYQRSKLGLVQIMLLLLIVAIAPLWTSSQASALVQNPTPTAKISFTFDDGLASATTQAAPTLAKYGLTGTNYVISGCVGMTTVPNTCWANTDTPYMTWAQIQALQNTSGWEIGSHTVDHQCLASNAAADPSDCQKTTMTTAQVDAELANSKSALAANGITATDFAPPYGDFNNNVITQIAKYYASMRQFKNASNNANVWPYSDYYLQDQAIQETTNTVANVESMINTAITNKQWLILTFHNITASPSKTPDDYQYGTAELDQIAAYVKSKQTAGLITPLNVNQGLVTSSTNLLPNSNFAAGLSGGWTTDSPTTILPDAANNGSYPNSTNSIKLTASAKNTQLFSPQITVDPNTTYLLKNFLNVSSITGGQVGFYIDEYDGSGNWISGQYKNGEGSAFVEDFSFTYTPSSASVKKARLQIIVTANSGVTAYFDNPQWFALSSITPPVQTNLVANGAFDSGIAAGWTTDDATHITADATNHGSPNNPVNSVLLKSTTKNIHLFSPKVAVTATKSYTMTSYLNLQQITSGEVGFYVDEYNSSGAWISGHYITGVTGVSAGDVSFQYKPSSSSVATASLQVIVVANSGISAYFDDVRWF